MEKIEAQGQEAGAAVERAIVACDGPVECAKRLRERTGRALTHQAVSHWRKAGTVPPAWVLDLAAIQNAVTREDLRPDLYPKEQAPKGRSNRDRRQAGSP